MCSRPWCWIRRRLGRSALAKRTNTNQANWQDQASDFVHELAFQSASNVDYQKIMLDPAAAIMPARFLFQSPTKVWLPVDAALSKICVREKGAAKIHQASRGAAHNHSSMDGVFCAH